MAEAVLPQKKKEDTVPFKLNEAVNFDLETIFIAVPKTGTTSIREQLTQPGPSLIPNPHLTIVQIRDSLYTFFLRQHLGSNKSFPTDPSDTLSDKEIRALADSTFDKFFKISSVRNPWARTLSLYNRREGLQMASTLDFDTFCKQLRYASDTCLHPTRLLNQLDWMTDENGTMLVDYVLRLEEREKGICDINERTGGKLKLENLHLNENSDSAAASYKEAYSRESKQHVAAIFKRDIEFFDYEF